MTDAQEKEGGSTVRGWRVYGRVVSQMRDLFTPKPKMSEARAALHVVALRAQYAGSARGRDYYNDPESPIQIKVRGGVVVEVLNRNLTGTPK